MALIRIIQGGHLAVLISQGLLYLHWPIIVDDGVLYAGSHMVDQNNPSEPSGTDCIAGVPVWWFSNSVICSTCTVYMYASRLLGDHHFHVPHIHRPVKL